VPRGQLLQPGGRADQHQVGHVDAADEQHERDAAPKQKQRRPHVADEIGLHLDRFRVESGVREDFFELRKALHVARVERVDLRLRLIDGPSRLQPADHLPVVAVPPIVRFVLGPEGDRDPQLRLAVQEQEVLRQHADDRVRDAVHPQVLSNRVVPSAEEALPEGVREDDLALLPDLAVGVDEQPAAMRLRPQDAEDGGRGLEPLHPLGLVVGPDRLTALAIERLFLEHVDLAASVEIVGNAVARPLDPRLRIAVHDGHELVRVGERQRAQQHGVDHAEDRGVGADAGGQRDDGGQREALLFEEQARRKTQILGELGHRTFYETARYEVQSEDRMPACRTSRSWGCSTSAASTTSTPGAGPRRRSSTIRAIW
jgi:hypothetical protein